MLAKTTMEYNPQKTYQVWIEMQPDKSKTLFSYNDCIYFDLEDWRGICDQITAMEMGLC